MTTQGQPHHSPLIGAEALQQRVLHSEPTHEEQGRLKAQVSVLVWDLKVVGSGVKEHASSSLSAKVGILQKENIR